MGLKLYRVKDDGAEWGIPEQKARAAQAIKAHIQAIPELKAQIEKGQDGKLATIRRVVEAMENALGKDAYGK